MLSKSPALASLVSYWPLAAICTKYFTLAMWGWVDGDGDECATDDQRRPPCLPARRRVERGTLPARLGLRVVRYGVESVGEADALTLSRFAPPVLASLELVRLIVHPLSPYWAMVRPAACQRSNARGFRPATFVALSEMSDGDYDFARRRQVELTGRTQRRRARIS